MKQPPDWMVVPGDGPRSGARTADCSVVEAAVRGGATAVQLREKSLQHAGVC